MSTVLIATGTIVPSVGSTVGASSSAVRRGQYEDALRTWLALTPWDVVFVENSSPELLEDLRRSLGSPRVRAISATASAAATARGKGACEGEMLLAAHAALGAEVTDVVKVTGRLAVSNIRRVMDLRPRPRTISVEYDARLRFCDARLFRLPADALRRSAVRLADEVDDPAGVYAEHVLMRCVLAELGAGAHLQPFGALPRFSGSSATTGERYDGAAGTVRHGLHSVARRLYLRSGMTL